MIFTTIRRVVRSGFMSFWRNGFVTVASILVVTVTLFVLGSLIFLDAMLDASLAQIREKVDINVYFTLDAPEEEMLAIRDSIEELPEVTSAEYVSREQALIDFQNRHEEDQLILQALEELESNPLGAHLNIQATDTSEYEDIAEFLESDQVFTSTGEDIIENVNYFQNREAIERLTTVISSIERLSVILLGIFIVISILIVFNTIRLAIFTSREEISVMKLVGASNGYVRGPFVIEGIMYGVVSALFALVLFYPLTLWIGPFTESFFGATNLFDYYVDNFAQMFVILVLSGAVLGAISSYLAVKKYLDV